MNGGWQGGNESTVRRVYMEVPALVLIECVTCGKSVLPSGTRFPQLYMRELDQRSDSPAEGTTQSSSKRHLNPRENAA